MARLARGDVFDPDEVSVFHCINRCVRQCFLCGQDPVSGKNFEHRKQWLEERFGFLAGTLGIDVLGFAILSNHFHIILRNRPDVVAVWDDNEVARRWLTICPLRKAADGSPEEPIEAELASITGDPERLAEIRGRLSHISWFMRLAAEPLARQANAEEKISGRFWQGRYRSVKLCDEAAILSCCVYVDLNPIRAGLAETPEESDFTSAQRRIEALAGPCRENAAEQKRSHNKCSSKEPRGEAATAGPAVAYGPAVANGLAACTDSQAADAWLAPLQLDERAASATGPAIHEGAARCSDLGFLPVTVEQYLELLDWTGRQLAAGKRGAIPLSLAPILERLRIVERNWLPLVRNFGSLFHRVAGRPASVACERSRRGGRFRPGQAQLLETPGVAL